MTRWAAEVSPKNALPEYPRPQFVRNDWLNLNGEWEFEIDQGDSGLERGLLKRPLAGKITVPFCPESASSAQRPSRAAVHCAVLLSPTFIPPSTSCFPSGDRTTPGSQR